MARYVNMYHSVKEEKLRKVTSPIFGSIEKKSEKQAKGFR